MKATPEEENATGRISGGGGYLGNCSESLKMKYLTV